MRRISLLLALLPALAAAQVPLGPSPPSAADSALVERLLPTLQLETAHAVMEDMAGQLDNVLAAETPDDPPPPWMADAFAGLFRMDLAATTDSVRAAFLRDLRPALVEDALAYLEGPTPAALLAQSRFSPESIDMVEMMALLEHPAGEPLADSALAARYAAAMWAASMPAEAEALTQRAVVDALPPDLRAMMDEAFAPVGGFEAMLRSQQATQQTAQADLMTRSARLSLAGVDDALVRETTTFYESEAGRYVMGTIALVQTRLLAPAVGALMRSIFEGMARPGLNRPGPPPPPAPPPPGAAGVHEVAEVQPTLLGGIEGLQRRVVYPESARRAGVEGQVIVQFIVDERGEVRDPVILRSPDAALSEAALVAVRGSQFTPGMQRGRPVKVRFAVPITFRLRDSQPMTDGDR